MHSIRKFAKDDYQSVLHLFRQLNASVTEFDAEAIVESASCYCAVIEKEGLIMGFGALVMHQVPTRGLVARIEDIVVDASQRGQGLGRALVEHLITQAKLSGVQSIDLTSNPARIVAHKLYESLGFEKRDTQTYRKKLV